MDDESRRKSNKSKLTCACREFGQPECHLDRDGSVVVHRHHAGNEQADERAKVGAGAELDGGEDFNEAARGEMWHILCGTTDFAQGEYKQWMQEKEHRRQVDPGVDQETEEGGEPGPKQAQKWARATRASDEKQRTAMLVSLDTKGHPTCSFWSRILCQSLPTYAQMMKYANGSVANDYQQASAGNLGSDARCVSWPLIHIRL